MIKNIFSKSYITKLNKTADLKWMVNDDIIRKETIYYKKYLKYKQKYLQLQTQLK